MKPVNALRALAPSVALAAGTGLLIALMITLSGSPVDRPAGGVLVTATIGTLIAGEDIGMVPGTVERRTVRLTNLHDTDMRVGRIGARASDPVDALGRPVTGCIPTVALVQPLESAITVPAHGTVEADLTVRLATTVQNECRFLRFRLAYSANTIRE
jgi:hypothetical protein